MAKTFGGPVNGAAFEIIARSLPLATLARLGEDQLEALLLGQAGLLEGSFQDEHPRRLQQEFHHLRVKYALPAHPVPAQFLRMRPGNFPTIRLAQLAALVNQSTHLFSRILEIKDIEALQKLLNVTANDYWHYHYCFDEETTYKPKNIGSAMTDNLIINTVIPLLFAYGIFHNAQQWKERAINFLTQLSPESNNITKQWKGKDVANKNALDSQALIELKNNYCTQKRCLNCAVGNNILKRSE